MSAFDFDAEEFTPEEMQENAVTAALAHVNAVERQAVAFERIAAAHLRFAAALEALVKKGAS